MTTCNAVKKLALGVVLCGLFAWQASATLAYNFPGPTGAGAAPGNQTDGPYTEGTVFTVNSSPVVVDALGVIDPGGVAFSSPVEVAIYSVVLDLRPRTIITDASLVSPVATFNPGLQTLSPGTETAIQSISPVSLGVGTYMIVAENVGGTTHHPIPMGRGSRELQSVLSPWLLSG